MSNIFSKIKNLPDAIEQKALDRRERLARSVAAIRQGAGIPETATAETSMAETGMTETRVIPYRCAKTSRRYTVTYERMSPAHRFRVARIVKEDGDNGAKRSGWPGSLFGNAPTGKTFDATEFDRSGLSCPWCGDATTTIRCATCGETVCGGRVRELANGARTFACHDGCGATGTLVSYDRVHGSAGAPALSFTQGGPKLPKPVSQKRLPDSGRKLLGGGRPLLDHKKK